MLLLDEIRGRGHRRDAVLPGTGGPAGNARVTSWLGLLLLVLIAGELITLLDVSGLIDWHAGLGIAMTGLALAKTASTGWRILRYYSRSRHYRDAGPPPTVLRALGPLVVLATLGVLGSGIALVAIGPVASRSSWLTVVGHPVTPVTLHQGFFLLFAGAAGLHLIARFLPALSQVSGRPPRPAHQSGRVPGRGLRAGLLVLTVAASVIAAVLVLPVGQNWQHADHRDHRVSGRHG